jgi:hypothetical protein
MAVPQLEDGQLRLGRVRVHDPVRGDAEPLVRGFLPVQVDQGGAGRADLNDEQRRLDELRVADLVHADHHQIGIKLGLHAKLDGRLGHDAQIFGAGVGQHAEQAHCDELVNCRRPGAHDEHPVQKLVPAAVIGHPVQLGDGERLPGGGPGLGDRHDTHGAPFCA